ncbi:8-amino-7-oxononanoate synthase OS=Castellaniella defragrans (strain DSM / CCUG 39792 / 65Phen)OX=1437824 GN=BN940_13311 PE=3 SV=1 [Castellaniella denitrificans]|uniref:aminotransferase class I/II-fold pyridoxal phosphate-dependent enzyme n=1 Tax=Castellaniella denitrificans TaxID=56119 RepID=UPI00360EB0C5
MARDLFDPLFEDSLRVAERRHLRRSVRVFGHPAPGRRDHGGREILDFCSNDYLGLSLHPELVARACGHVRRHGAGATASRLVCGTGPACAATEARIARAKGTQAALLFSSGWQANAAILPALSRALGADAQVYVDRLVHASLHQGCRAAGIRQIRFRHNDLDHLEALLRARAGQPGRRMIVTESVFSMDGDRCDVAALAALAERHGAFLYLDEAHATGVLGPDGMGLSGLAGGRVDLAMGTFSKAMGGFGAYVAGSRALCDYLANTCSGFVHTTALPPAVLGAIDAALDLVPGMRAEREALADKADALRGALRSLGLDTGASSTQIVPVLVGDERRALALSEALEARGVLVTAIRPPTVPRGTSRLRIALSAAHTRADIERLVDALSDALEAVA